MHDAKKESRKAAKKGSKGTTKDTKNTKKEDGYLRRPVNSFFIILCALRVLCGSMLSLRLSAIARNAL
jgi:hypothetical protein